MINMILYVRLGVITSPCLSLCWLQSVVTIEDGKMVHIQKWDGKETSLVREVNGNALTLVSARTKCVHTHTAPVCVCLLYFNCRSLSITDTHTRRCCLHAFLREGRVNPNTRSPQHTQYLHQLKPCTSNSLTPHQPRPSKPLDGCCRSPSMSLHTVRSVLTLLLTVTSPFSMSFSLYCCSFYCKKH